MDDELRKRLAARLAASPPPALERARSFLRFYIHDSDGESLQWEVKNSAAGVMDGIEAIEEVLALPQEPGTLYRMAAYEGNQMLEDETDETAAAWLLGLTAQLREMLGDDAPPVRHS